MTEIPEHLLKRSQERRAAMGLAGDGGGDAGGGDAAPGGGDTPSTAVTAASAAAPATVASTPAEVEPAAPAPVTAHVEAAMRRKRVPIWAVPVLAALPVWAFIYAATLEPPSLGESDPLAVGQALYASNCSSCHGATGGGGVGPAIAGGAVIENFADPIDQIEWIVKGSQGFLDEGRATYGDLNAPIAGGMPAWGGTLEPEEIAAIVYYERSGLSDEAPNEVLLSAEGQLLVDGEPVVLAGGEGGGH